MQTITIKESNKLFPVFLKLEELHVLLVGAGNVGLEKLQAILNNAPATSITIIAADISEEIKPYKEAVTLYPVSSFFPQEYFVEKYVVHLPI